MHKVLRGRLACMFFCVSALGAGPVHAIDTFIPCSGDAGGNLVSVFAAASLYTGANTLTLEPGCTYTVSGNSAVAAPDASPTVFQPLLQGTIPFSGPVAIIIIGNGATIARNPATGPARFFYVGPTATLVLVSLTLKDGISRGQNGGDSQDDGTPGTGGTWSGLGGAVMNDGTLTADTVTFEGNQAIGGNGGGSASAGAPGGGGAGMGGAIFSRGALTVVRSSLIANGATGGANGAVRGCSGCQSAGGGGGGLGGTGGGPATGAGGFGGAGGGAAIGGTGGNGGFGGGGGGGANQGAAGEFGGNAGIGGFGGGGGAALGGAIFIEAVSAGGAQIVNSTFSANGTHGGATHTGGDGGSAAGGAIFLHAGQLSVDYATLVGGAAGGGNAISPGNPQSGGNAWGAGIYVHAGATLLLGHSIIHGDVVTPGTSDVGGSGLASDPDAFGVLSSGGYNLVHIRGASSGWVVSDLPDGTDPLLGPLKNNRGTTLTFLPLAASPAIDAGMIPPGDCPAVDQRGQSRPWGSTCDIGAVEVDDTLFRDGFEPTY